MKLTQHIKLIPDLNYISIFYTYSTLTYGEKVCMLYIVGKQENTYVLIPALIGQKSGVAVMPPVQRSDLSSVDELDRCIVYDTNVAAFKQILNKETFYLRTNKLQFPENCDAASAKNYIDHLIRDKKAPLPKCLLSHLLL